MALILELALTSSCWVQDVFCLSTKGTGKELGAKHISNRDVACAAWAKDRLNTKSRLPMQHTKSRLPRAREQAVLDTKGKRAGSPRYQPACLFHPVLDP